MTSNRNSLGYYRFLVSTPKGNLWCYTAKAACDAYNAAPIAEFRTLQPTVELRCSKADRAA